MSKIVDIAPLAKIPLVKDQVFTYLSEKNLQAGQLVSIPLGRRKVEGIVIQENSQNKYPKLKQITKIIDEKPVLTTEQLQLANWMSEYYLTPLGIVLKSMLPRRAVRKKARPLETPASEKSRKLTTAQKKALDIVLESSRRETLLHGVTGSGKTEVYLQALAKNIEEGKQGIVLIPEISLTPQTIRRFIARFGSKQVAVWNSRLTYTNRFHEWDRIRKQEAKIIIGPRSALFCPVQKLGLIVIDEEHETTYKQWDQHPRYDARRVATEYAKITDSKLVLGSATPSLEAYYRTQAKDINLAKLEQRINESPLPEVKVIDMRNELAAGNRSVISENLREKIQKTLENKEQVILFINRRGSSTFVMCRDCGHVIECPNCSVSLTYHLGKKQKLLCHHCGHTEKVPNICPQCKSERIKFFGAGTQKIETEIRKLFPRSKILRMDADTTKTKDAHTLIFDKFALKKGDILIGTQMITKGFDLPNVALVGIISADTSLSLPEFRSQERTFQLITQVAGRTGRGDRPGQVVLQTYQPEEPAITAAKNHDFVTFYNQEISVRKQLGYPPFSRFVKLTITHTNDNLALKKASEILEKLNKLQSQKIKIKGPAPALVKKKHGKNSWHIIIQYQKNLPPEIKNFILKLDNNWSADIDPLDLLS